MDVDPVALALADPVPVLLSFARNNPILNEEIGDASHFSGALRAPYPHIVLSTSAGGAPSDGFWGNHPELLLEAYSAPDGLPGKAELRRILVLTAAVLAAYPDEGLTSSVCAITNVRITSPFIFGPDLRVQQTPAGGYVGGQYRWFCSLQVD